MIIVFVMITARIRRERIPPPTPKISLSNYISLPHFLNLLVGLILFSIMTCLCHESFNCFQNPCTELFTSIIIWNNSNIIIIIITITITIIMIMISRVSRIHAPVKGKQWYQITSGNQVQPRCNDYVFSQLCKVGGYEGSGNNWGGKRRGNLYVFGWYVWFRRLMLSFSGAWFRYGKLGWFITVNQWIMYMYMNYISFFFVITSRNSWMNHSGYGLKNKKSYRLV